MTEKNTSSTTDTQSASQEKEQAQETKPAVQTQTEEPKKVQPAEKTEEKPAPAQKIKTDAAKPKASKPTPTSSTRMTNTRKRSKTAIAALIFSVTALAGLGGGYVWQNQQHLALMDELLQQNQHQLQATETQLAQLINQQQTATLNSAKQDAEQISTKSLQPITEELAALKSVTQALQQNDPTDWLIHEAEYLIRVASRAMWLEKDAQVAINLLQDADLRVKELNNPELLPVRQLINQDIESLKLLPELATEDVILQLIALSNNINDLPIAMAHLPDATTTDADFELSENAADWRENLSKTWQKFIADFITVKRRTANVEALLTPNQQQNLRQNLQLKLQLAQWAATQHNAKLFDNALIEAQAWLSEYFDTDDNRVANFNQALQMLQSAIIELTLPEKLDSLSAIRGVIKQQSAQSIKVVPVEADISGGNSSEEMSPSDAEQPKADDSAAQQDDNGAIL